MVLILSSCNFNSVGIRLDDSNQIKQRITLQFTADIKAWLIQSIYNKNAMDMTKILKYG